MSDVPGHVEKVTGSQVEPKPTGAPEGMPDANAAAKIAANYEYWREHGGGWASEYDQRKKDQIYYHIQEIMLTEYVGHHAPAKVLEFGCGPGRHLRNLSRLPGIEVFGYDQSAAMVSGARAWASQAWLDAHVTIGLPTGRLPFEDKQFDLVYTAEVLVHVRPEDLQGVLRELVRISRRQVFHLETSPQHQLVSDEHSGCWWHDLPSAYAAIGLRCEMLASGYATHAPYRVMLGQATPTWEWSPLFLELCRRMDRDVSYGMDMMRGSLHGEKEARARESEHARSAAADLERRLRAELEAARGETARLDAELARARAEAVASAARAEREASARDGLTSAVHSLEVAYAEAQRRIASLEQLLNEYGQREADFVRAVERRLWRS
jgi:SAM-dependent methyltransferase